MAKSNGVTVRILHEGGVGGYKKDELVKNAHDGLVEIAKRGVRNAADGELLAEIVSGKVEEPEQDGGADGVQSEDSNAK